jgi:two-component system chemotaxis response regulator CheB
VVKALGGFSDSNYSPTTEAAAAVNFDVIGLCASAGGLPALVEIVSALPSDFPAAIMVVQHTLPGHRTQLAHILGRHTLLPSKIAEAGDVVRPGQIYVADAGRHLVIHPGGHIALSDSARANFTRPAADLLLLSMALELRDHAFAVVLSGFGSDGAMGVRAVKGAGGVTIAQERSGVQPGMPEAAIATGCVDLVLPSCKIARALIALTMVKGAPTWFRSPALIR